MSPTTPTQTPPAELSAEAIGRAFIDITNNGNVYSASRAFIGSVRERARKLQSNTSQATHAEFNKELYEAMSASEAARELPAASLGERSLSTRRRESAVEHMIAEGWNWDGLQWCRAPTPSAAGSGDREANWRDTYCNRYVAPSGGFTPGQYSPTGAQMVSYRGAPAKPEAGEVERVELDTSAVTISEGDWEGTYDEWLARHNLTAKAEGDGGEVES